MELSPAVGYGCLDSAVFVIFFKHTVLFASEVASFASEIAVRIIGNFSAFGFALAIIADFFFRAVRIIFHGFAVRLPFL